MQEIHMESPIVSFAKWKRIKKSTINSLHKKIYCKTEKMGIVSE